MNETPGSLSAVGDAALSDRETVSPLAMGLVLQTSTLNRASGVAGYLLFCSTLNRVDHRGRDLRSVAYNARSYF